MTDETKFGPHIVQYPSSYSLCAGCTSCELVCSLLHDGVSGHGYNRIFLDRNEPSMIHDVYACMQCVDHPCHDACPAKIGAMQIDPDTGVVYIDEDKCIGCGLCVKACPFTPKRINIVKTKDRALKKAKKCDLCRGREGGPACIEWCPVRCIGMSDQPMEEGQGIGSWDFAQDDGQCEKLNDVHSYAYTGKIARINLTEQTVSIVNTSDYVPKYIGGRAIANRIHYDEVGPGVKAFDPENKIIYMTGPTTGTGIPTGGRSVFTAIAPNNLPEQYAWSGLGGWLGAEMKFAGWDGLIIEGKAEKPTYLWIEDDIIQFMDASPLWGKLVHATQGALKEIHGKNVESVVIGPAGENLMRNASITTSNDNVAAKAGFGAVFGSKNLKAITVRGTQPIRPYDIEKLFELRKNMGTPYMRPNPIIHEEEHGMDGNKMPVEGGWDRGQVACSHGCNQHCCRLMIDVPSAFSDTETVNQVEKCVGIFAYGFQEDCSWRPIMTWETEQNSVLPCKMLSCEPPMPDLDDPHFSELFVQVKGDITNYWKPDFHKGSVMMHMCNEYGIDKWDVIVWYMTWLSSAKKEGLLDEIDFDMEVDVENEEFVKYFLDMITYRKGKWGQLFGEGMARAIRALGKEKYGDTIYNGRYSQEIPGLKLDIPVSLESAWGMSYHWSGRGYEATIDRPGWLAIALELMTVTRDNQTVSHFHDTFDHRIAIGDDPCHSKILIDSVIMNENKGEMKDSVSTCEWQSPDLFWTSMEAEMYTAAAGIEITEKELDEAASRSKLLMRAITMRNHDRTREMEVNAIFPTLQFPDPHGEMVEWDEWNDFVDLYYEARGWDKETGWPTRETWEKFGLADIADDMEKLGKLPV